MDYITATLEEIALEGLQGITPNDLLSLLAQKFQHINNINVIWTFILSKLTKNENIFFYMTNLANPNQSEDVKELVRTINEKGLACYTQGNDLIMGHCPNYDQRIHVTNILKSYDVNKLCSLITNLKDDIFIVGSQEIRFKALFGSQYVDYSIISIEAYTVLEKIGKMREKGIMSNDPFWKTVNMDSKKLFYQVKAYLLPQKLVTKMSISISNESSTVFYLTRYSQLNPIYCKALHIITMYLNSLKSKSAALKDLCSKFNIKSSLIEYILRYSHEYLVTQDIRIGNETLIRIQLIKIYNHTCTNPFQNMPSVPVEDFKGVFNNDTCVDATSVNETREMDNDSDNEVDNFEENDKVAKYKLFSPHILTPKIPMLSQIFSLISASHSTGGYKVEELRYLKGLSRPETRCILKELNKWSLVTSVNKSIGRQTVGYYILKGISIRAPIYMDFHKAEQSLSEKVDESGKAIIKNISESDHISTLTMDRMRFIINYISSERVLSNYFGLYNALKEHESKMGSPYTICRKTVTKLVDRLIALKAIRIIKLSIKSNSSVDAALITLSDVTVDDPTVLKYIELLKMNHKQSPALDDHSLIDDKPFENLKVKRENDIKDEKEDIVLDEYMPSALDTSKSMHRYRKSNELLAIHKMCMNKDKALTLHPELHIVLVPNINKTYGNMVKFEKCREMHKYLFYLDSIEPPAGDIDNADLGNVKYRDEHFPPWLRYIPFSRESKKKSWISLKRIIENMPLSIYLKIVNIQWEVNGLLEWLEDPDKRHRLITQLPPEMQAYLLYHSVYINSCKNVFDTLLTMGLIAIDRTSQLYIKISIWLNPCTILKDTRISLPGKPYIRHPSTLDKSSTEASTDPYFPKKHYTFDRLEQIESYWQDVKEWALRTPLLSKSSPGKASIENERKIIICRKQRFLKKMRCKLEDSRIIYGSINERSAQNDLKCASCKNELPGDGLGACGFDSSLNTHRQRNWNVDKVLRSLDNRANFNRANSKKGGLRSGSKLKVKWKRANANDAPKPKSKKSCKKVRMKDIKNDNLYSTEPRQTSGGRVGSVLKELSDTDSLVEWILKLGFSVEDFFSHYIHEKARSRNLSYKLLSIPIVMRLMQQLGDQLPGSMRASLLEYEFRQNHIHKAKNGCFNPSGSLHKFVFSFLITLPDLEQAFQGLQSQSNMEKLYESLLARVIRFFLPVHLPPPQAASLALDSTKPESIEKIYNYHEFMRSISFFNELSSIDSVGNRTYTLPQALLGGQITQEFYASLLICRTLWVTLGYRDPRSYNTPLWRLRPLEVQVCPSALISIMLLLNEYGQLKVIKSSSALLIQHYYRDLLSSPLDPSESNEQPFWTYLEGGLKPALESCVKGKDFRYESGLLLRNLLFRLPKNCEPYFEPLYLSIHSFISSSQSLPFIRPDEAMPFYPNSAHSSPSPLKCSKKIKSFHGSFNQGSGLTRFPKFEFCLGNQVSPYKEIQSIDLMDMVLSNFETVRSCECIQPFFTSLLPPENDLEPRRTTNVGFPENHGVKGSAKIRYLRRRPYTFKYEWSTFLGHLLHPSSTVSYTLSLDVGIIGENSKEVDDPSNKEKSKNAGLMKDLPPYGPLRRMLQLYGVPLQRPEDIETYTRGYNNPYFDQVSFIPFQANVQWIENHDKISLDEKVENLVPLLGLVSKNLANFETNEEEKTICKTILEAVAKAGNQGIAENEIIHETKQLNLSSYNSFVRYLYILLKTSQIFPVGTMDIKYITRDYIGPWCFDIGLNTSAELPALKKLSGYKPLEHTIEAHFFIANSEELVKDENIFAIDDTTIPDNAIGNKRKSKSAMKNEVLQESVQDLFTIGGINHIIAYPWHDMEALLQPIPHSNLMTHYGDGDGSLRNPKPYNFYLLYLFTSTILDMVIAHPAISEELLRLKVNPILGASHLRILLNFLIHGGFIYSNFISTIASSAARHPYKNLFKKRDSFLVGNDRNILLNDLLCEAVYFVKDATDGSSKLRDYFCKLGFKLNY